MAMEKQHAGGRHPMVDQDAAITDYLDGLLRDPDGAEPAAPEPPRTRRGPGLKVINVAEPVEDEGSGEFAPEPIDDATEDESLPEATPSVAAEAPAPPSDAAVVPEPPPVDEQVDGKADEITDEALATASDNADEEEALPETVAVEEEIVEEASESDQAEDPDQSESAEEASRWRWLRVGGMLMALPEEDIVSRHPEPALAPVPGAPAHIAGSLEVDGRLRLILSLSGLTGARPRPDAGREVFLLGKGGLWGVLGEPVEQPVALDAEAVEWRSDEQRQARRAWLAGTAPSSGVAVLDAQGLRAALKNRN